MGKRFLFVAVLLPLMWGLSACQHVDEDGGFDTIRIYQRPVDASVGSLKIEVIRVSDNENIYTNTYTFIHGTDSNTAYTEYVGPPATLTINGTLYDIYTIECGTFTREFWSGDDDFVNNLSCSQHSTGILTQTSAGSSEANITTTILPAGTDYGIPDGAVGAPVVYEDEDADTNISLILTSAGAGANAGTFIWEDADSGALWQGTYDYDTTNGIFSFVDGVSGCDDEYYYYVTADVLQDYRVLNVEGLFFAGCLEVGVPNQTRVWLLRTP